MSMQSALLRFYGEVLIFEFRILIESTLVCYWDIPEDVPTPSMYEDLLMLKCIRKGLSQLWVVFNVTKRVFWTLGSLWD